MTKYKWLLIPSVLTILLLLGLSCSLGGTSVPKEARPLVQAWDLLFDKFVDKDSLSPALLQAGAIEGMLQILDEATASSINLETIPSVDSGFDGAFNVTGGEELRAVFGVWQFLDIQLADQGTPKSHDLTVAAIVGLLEEVDDPFTSYLSPAGFTSQQEAFEGSFEGIGAFVALRDGKITIIAPIPGTPAERAGIRPGDIILEVNGISTDGFRVEDAVVIIRGPKGTAVRLLILHEGETEPVLIEIVRDKVDITSVIPEIVAPQIARIQITSFSDRTDSELKDSLEDLLSSGDVKGIVIDLRNNPGGLLRTTVTSTSQFLKEGLVLYELDGDGNRTDHLVRSGGLAKDIPIAVLVNEFSASGSEVFAGAIQDHGRGPLIGTTTFGKGSVNQLFQLSDDSGLFITIARWFTPQGNQIDNRGLTPDIEVETTLEDLLLGRDSQLERAIQYVQSQIGQTSLLLNKAS